MEESKENTGVVRGKCEMKALLLVSLEAVYQSRILGVPEGTYVLFHT